MIFHQLDKNTAGTYIYRAYEEYGTLRYKFAMPVSYRGGGMFEAHAWNSIKLLWPSAPLSAFSDAMEWIAGRLKELDSRFRFLIGTFEVARLKIYERMFKSKFALKIVNVLQLTYNGATDWFAVVWFKEKRNEKTIDNTVCAGGNDGNNR